MTISVALALDLREAGLRWTPRSGDRFVLPHRNMDQDVFVLSHMTIEVHEFPTGAVIGFNGVAEWALDSVEVGDALWMPSEDQLRELLGGLFVALAADHPDDADDHARTRFTVTVRDGDQQRSTTAPDAAEAYGLALLEVLKDLR